MKHFFILSTVFCLSLGIANGLEAKTLEFEEAYQDVLDNAFELSAANAGLNARGAERWQAKAYPNPELSAGIDSIGPCSNNEKNELYLGLTQLFELGGKRKARMRVAEAEESSTAWDVEILKCDLYTALLHAFIDVAVAQERVELAKTQQSISNQTFDCICTKSDAGKGCLLESKKAEIACKTTKLFLTKQISDLSQVRKVLLTFWDCRPPQFESVNYPLYELTPPPPFEELIQSITSNPVLSKAHAELVKAWEILRLERSNRIPDLSVEIGVTTERYARDPALSFGIDIALPIFDQNYGNICRASYEHTQALYNQMDATCHLETALTVVYEEWCAAYEQAIALKETIIPPATESYNLTEMSFKEGKYDYLYLLDARSTLFNIKQQYLDAVEDYHHKRADALKLTAKCCPFEIH